MKKFIVVLVLLSLVTVLIGACGGSSGSGSGMTVHLGNTNFLQSSVTISKGDSLTLVDDVAVVHIIQNGSWDSNGTPKPATEAGAPTVNVQFQGSDTHMVGPFDTAGTFHLFCSIHVGMNLTVIVQ